MTTTYTDARIEELVEFLRHFPTAAECRDAANALETLLAERQAASQGKGWTDPTGFSVDGIRDEANNWTRRDTGKQMLLNYAAALTHFAANGQEKQS